MSDQPTISVIIPAHNEEDTIGACLASLRRLNYPAHKLEIVLINDGSTDATEEIINSYRQESHLVYLKTEGVGPSKARNMGLRRATGEYVAFTDADCIADEEWLNEMLRGFIDGDVVGVGGSQHIPENATSFEKDVHSFLAALHFISEYMKSAKEIKKVKHVASCNSMYKRSVVEEVGAFDEKLWPGEDVDLDYKITRKGYSIAYNPRAVVEHHRPQNLKGFFNLMRRYGWAQAYLIRKHGVFRKLHYVPFMEALFLIAWILLMIYNLYWGVGLAIGLIACAIIGFVLKSGVRKGMQGFRLFVITLAAWNIGFGSYLIRKAI